MSPLLFTEMAMGKKDGASRNVNDSKSVWIGC
jgi:hypothetical protein